MNFLPAETVAADGGPGIAISNGATPNVLKLGAGMSGRIEAPGRAVVLGIRPEKSHALRSRAAGPPRSRSARGARRCGGADGGRDHGGAAGRRKGIDCALRADDAPSVGERVTLAVDMAKACVFDRVTEQLI
jgi:multiple sugar transport system ATP-binding protein